MLLKDLLNTEELDKHIQSKHIRIQSHPTLPLFIYNYSNECLFEDYWPDVVCKCRGLITTAEALYDERRVIARPFHKFFNLGHNSQPDYQEANLPVNVTPEVTEKMDGWFGIMWEYEGNYGIASRGSFTSPGAEFATAKLAKLIKYGAMEEFPKGYSPIFEIISKITKIVVDYPYESLVLLGCVNTTTGEELPYDKLKEIWANIAIYSADKPWIRIVKAHHMTIKDCMLEEKKNFEGYILTYSRPGTWPIKVKVKLEPYKQLHRLITGVTPQQIWKAIHDPMAPWFAQEVPESFRLWARSWRDKLYGEFDHKYKRTLVANDDSTLAHLKFSDRGAYVARLKKEWPDVASAALALADGKIYSAHQCIWDTLRPVGRETETFYREGEGE